MKKIFILLLVVVSLVACKNKRDDYFVFSYGDKSIAVGYDEECDETIKHKKTYNEESKKEILSYVELYLKDLKDKGYIKYSINSVDLDTSIKSNCEKLNGRYIEQNGYTCLVTKNIDDKLLILELHGNILNDDMDELDHIIIKYE